MHACGLEAGTFLGLGTLDVDVVFLDEALVSGIFNGIILLNCLVEDVIEFEIAAGVKIPELPSQEQVVRLLLE